MKNKVLRLTEDIKSLDKRDHEEFLKWLSEMDDWDLEIKTDSQEGRNIKLS